MSSRPDPADRQYKSAVGVRGDSLYCPLPLSIDAYWNCLTDCHHCYFRHLNRTWGQDLRPADPEAVRRKLTNGLRASKPKSPLACALAHKITLRLGNKTDPYQEVEREMRVTRRIQQVLHDLDWTYVIQTRFLHNLLRDRDIMLKPHLFTVMPVISPGAERDWEILERKRTTPIDRRLTLIKRMINWEWYVGVNGEPFIPGYHTPEEFRSTVRRLREAGVESYNTYNFHFNAYVAERLADIGVDVERIWYHNQDRQWRPILRQLLDIAKEEGMRLGCPDFVNTGWKHKEPANTCCGIQVPNPATGNTHYWKQAIQVGMDPEEALNNYWEGIGDYDTALKIVTGCKCQFYTMKEVVE